MPQELGGAIQESTEDDERDDCDSDKHNGVNANIRYRSLRLSAGRHFSALRINVPRRPITTKLLAFRMGSDFRETGRPTCWAGCVSRRYLVFQVDGGSRSDFVTDKQQRCYAASCCDRRRFLLLFPLWKSRTITKILVSIGAAPGPCRARAWPSTWKSRWIGPSQTQCIFSLLRGCTALDRAHSPLHART